MQVAVAGATGSVGAPIAAELSRRGHTVRALSRSAPEYPVDVATGDGLDEALAGCDAVVDAVNASPSSRNMRAVLIDGSRNLLAAGERAGVTHHLCLSIVGCERVPMPYYRAKVEQEEVVRAGPVPSTILRATQFHTLLDWAFGGAARLRLLPGGSARIQPCDPREVAAAVADVLEGEPRPGGYTVAGPEVHELGELARTWKAATGRRGAVVPVPWTPSMGRPLRAGALTEPEPDHRCSVGFGEWLRARASGFR